MLPRALLVRRRLSDPAAAGVPIGLIALQPGFGDLSAFNQHFRQCFDTTPSDMRAAALSGWRDGSA